MDIRVIVDDEEFFGKLYDNNTARKISELLPLKIPMSRWGDEYYGSIEADIVLDADATDEMQIGELAFWPPGSAFCIFFGPTPASTGSEPRMASEGNPFGILEGDFSSLRAMGGSVSVRVETT